MIPSLIFIKKKVKKHNTKPVLEANTNYRKFQPGGLVLDWAYEKENKEVESIFNCRQHYSSTYNIRVGSDSPEIIRKNDVRATKQIFLPSINVSKCCTWLSTTEDKMLSNSKTLEREDKVEISITIVCLDHLLKYKLKIISLWTILKLQNFHITPRCFCQACCGSPHLQIYSGPSRWKKFNIIQQLQKQKEHLLCFRKANNFATEEVS